MGLKKVLVIAAAFAAAVTVANVVGARAASPYDWAANLPGCHPSAPAVAHNANQQVLNPQPTNGPVPCGVLTGYPTVETRIEVTNNHQEIYEPVLTAGLPVDGGSGDLPGGVRNGLSVGVTSNNGATWSPVTLNPWPGDEIGAQVDNNIYVDHTTGRAFWYMYSSSSTPGTAGGCGGVIGGATVAFSDDGTNWTWGFDRSHDCAENPDIITGVPRVSDPSQMSYPNLVYLCGDDTSSGAATLGTPGFSCSKSLSGGVTWLGSLDNNLPTENPQGFFSGEAKDLLDPYSQCGGQSSSADADVQPLPNGTLVVLVTCNSKTFLSESKDEGATWKITNQIPHGGTLRIDSAGNMYLVEVVNEASHMTPDLPVPGGASSGNSKILLSHSTDGGVKWSPEVNMVAPGVTSVGTWNFAQGTYAPGMVGNVAVTYYGIDPKSIDGKKGYSDGFITQTRDALTPNPVFWSGEVNNPGHPLLYNATTDGDIGITVLDFNGGALSPDGLSAWGSWVQDCGTNIATSPNCQSRLPGTNPGLPENGFAGRLAWPPPQR
ncbi:MAG TPA: hypothetical protein VFV02_10025 [Acidimicrobiales bacterium]|nr:hypothetical protein [Acidimicrobiales bacterium]